MSRRSRIRIGVMGCGWVAERAHLPALARMADFEVAALADVDVARAAELARKFKVPRTFADSQALFLDRTLDAVAICVPPMKHADAVIHALDAGKHVFVEKPLAALADDVERIVHRADRGPGVTLVGFNLRHHRLIRRTKRLLQSGALGRIEVVTTAFCTGKRARPPAWRGARASGGGVLFDLATHHFDLLRFLFESEIENVSAVGRGSDDSAAVSARLSNGVLVSMVLADDVTDANEIVLYGERGLCRLRCYRTDGLEIAPRDERALARLTRSARSTMSSVPRMVATAGCGGEYGAAYDAQWRHFAACCRGEAAPLCSAEDGARATRAAVAAIESLLRPPEPTAAVER